MFYKLKIPIASNKKIPSWKKNRQCNPYVPNETICNPIVQEMMDKLKIPAALSKNFPSLKKTYSANYAWLTKQSTIQSSKSMWTSSKFQLRRAIIFNPQTRHSAIQ